MIYADYAATTPLDKEVFEKMLPCFFDEYANASSVHNMGRNASTIVEKARQKIATAINCKKNEIYFTSGGTESDNWAIKGYAEKNNIKHIITSSIEHHAVLNTIKKLEENGIQVTYLDVDEYGKISIDQLEKSITPQTGLISIMTANNEIGTVQDIEKIGEIANKYNIPFHTDAVQAIGNVNIDVEKDNISMLSASAHKFYGPKGIGFLYIKNGLKIENQFYGGSQEKDSRPGTLNTPLIVGMGYAMEKAVFNMKKNQSKQKESIGLIKNIIINEIDDVYFNGDPQNRLSGILSLTVKNVQAEGLLFLLDMKGVCVSAGAACSAGAVKTSHVISAIGKQNCGGTIRISVSHLTTLNEARIIADSIVDSVKNLREN